VKPAPFDYVVAESVEHALAAKRRYGDEARFLAGGQSLVPAMNFRLAQPAVLIDLNRIPGLGDVRRENDVLAIGALARHRTLEHDPNVARHAPALAEAATYVAHPQIRNRGTLGGNLAQADPASELPAAAVALDASLHVRSAGSERQIAARDFFTGVFATALEPDEMLVRIDVPALPPRTGTAFMEIARRRGDYAIVGIAAVVTVDDARRCVRVRAVLCGAGNSPVCLAAPERVLAGHRGSEAGFAEAAALAGCEIDPPANVHATADYRRHLAGVLVRRALALAVSRAEGGDPGGWPGRPAGRITT
jgi:carbon-monoxide dehydrogenase medium subunit